MSVNPIPSVHGLNEGGMLLYAPQLLGDLGHGRSQGVEDPVGKLFLAQLIPEVLGRVQDRGIGGQAHQGYGYQGS